MKYLVNFFKSYRFIVAICFVLLGISNASFGTVVKNTKIVATIGPATDTVEKLSELINNGVNVVRLNFSHASHDYHQKLIDNARKASQQTGKKIAILADLQGPKIRIGKFANDRALIKTGDSFTLDLQKDKLGNSKRVYFRYPKIIKALQKGNIIYINDGKIKLEVEKANSDSLRCKVVSGGMLKNNKGVNIPNVVLPVNVITEKDKKDLKFALKFKPDWVALSFVQSEKEIHQLRKMINDNSIKIIAKIETIPSIQEKTLTKIAKAADAIMIARGDLSVELGIENIAVAEKKIMNVMKKLKKPYVVATQMIESMMDSIRPYNAEVVDISYAVYNNADAVMLSGESAIGKHPTETVKMMSAIINVAENKTWKWHNARKHYDSGVFAGIALFADVTQSDYIILKLNDIKGEKEFYNILARLSSTHPNSNIFVSGVKGKYKTNSLMMLRNLYFVDDKVEKCSAITSKGLPVAKLENNKLFVTYCKLPKKK